MQLGESSEPLEQKTVVELGDRLMPRRADETVGALLERDPLRFWKGLSALLVALLAATLWFLL